MKTCGRFFAGLTLVLAAVGLLLSLAGAVGVWVVKGAVTDRAAQVFGRVEVALGVADQGLVHVKASLDRAAERLEGVKQEQERLAGEPANATRRLLARTVQRQVAPEIDNAHDAILTVAEAAAVVNSVLEDVGNIPALSSSGLDLTGLATINGRLSEVESSAWELSRLFGQSGSEANPGDAGAELSRIERTLTAMRAVVADYEPRLADVRRRTTEVKARALGWLTTVSLLASTACLWIALSQISLMCHARGWWKGCPGKK